MSRSEPRPVSKKRPGTSSDVCALAAGKVERAQLYASVTHAAAARAGALVVVAGGRLDASGGALTLGYGSGAGSIGWKALAALAAREPTLLVVTRPAPIHVVGAVLDLVETSPRMEACFLDYVVWLPGGLKNPTVDRINARINASAHLGLTGYILDPEGRPGIIVGRLA
jgi:hypothetical protein